MYKRQTDKNASFLRVQTRVSLLEDFLSLVSGNNISVARAADRILRIEDGVIKMALTPTEAIAEEKAVSYIDQIRARITEIEEELLQLDENFKTGKISGDEYVEKRQRLKQVRDSLREELHRMGIVT